MTRSSKKSNYFLNPSRSSPPLISLFSARLITPSMYKAACLYAALYYKYLRAIEAPCLSRSSSFEEQILFRGKRPKKRSQPSGSEDHSVFIEHKLKKIQKTLVKREKNNNNLLHVVNSIVLDETCLKNMSFEEQLSQLREGLTLLERRLKK